MAEESNILKTREDIRLVCGAINVGSCIDSAEQTIKDKTPSFDELLENIYKQTGLILCHSPITGLYRWEDETNERSSKYYATRTSALCELLNEEIEWRK